MIRTQTLIPALVAGAALTLAGTASAQTAAEVIAKARAYLGGEQALNAVQSIHYSGTRETSDGAKASMEIIFQRPYRHRMTVTAPNLNDQIRCRPGIRCALPAPFVRDYNASCSHIWSAPWKSPFAS